MIFNKILLFLIVISPMITEQALGEDETIAIKKVDGVTCYVQPFSNSKLKNYCVGVLIQFGSTLLASGAQWGDLTILQYMGTVKYRGNQGSCEAIASDERLSGTLWVNDGIIEGYKFGKGRHMDSSTYCIFSYPNSKKMMSSFHKGETVYIKKVGDKELINGFNSTAINSSILPAFFEESELNTNANIPLNYYKPGIKGYVDGLLKKIKALF